MPGSDHLARSVTLFRQGIALFEIFKKFELKKLLEIRALHSQQFPKLHPCISLYILVYPSLWSMSFQLLHAFSNVFINIKMLFSRIPPLYIELSLQKIFETISVVTSNSKFTRRFIFFSETVNFSASYPVLKSYFRRSSTHIIKHTYLVVFERILAKIFRMTALNA